MMVQSSSASALGVIKPAFSFELLVGLLAAPACLDQACKITKRGVLRQVGDIVLEPSTTPPLADEPNFVTTWQTSAAALHLCPICHPYPDRGKVGHERPLAPLPPSDLARCPCSPRPAISSGERRLERCCRRSEEHTSELQSRGHLVCRLLLEKKTK